MNPGSAPVLIVGGGPVGLTLGIDLSHRGVASLLVDQSPRDARSEHPRMDQVGVRSMEIVRSWGEAAAICEAGFPRSVSRDVAFVTGVLGYELEREPVECDATRAPPPFSPEKHELCPQNFFDPALQRIADKSSLLEMRYGVRLVDFVNGADEVHATFEDVSTGAKFKRRARFLAACDGADSFVARALGIEAEASTVLAQSTNIFLRSRALTAATFERQAYRYILVDESGVWGSMINVSGQDIWRVQVLSGDPVLGGSDEAAHSIIQKAIGRPISYKLLSVVPWIRRELIRERFAEGRCFLVGDAAHQLSPTGGYGMNTGIAEAANLSWKLAAAIEGWAGSRLLQSYQVERRPVARRAIKRASVNFNRMRGAPSDPNLMNEGAAGEAARARIGREIRTGMAEEWDSFGIHLGYSYAGSPIVVADEAEPPPDDSVGYHQTSTPGARAPHVWLADGRSTLDLFGRSYVLLVFSNVVDPQPLVRAAASQSMPLEVIRIRNLEAARAYERPMVLVRPDGHVAWRGDTLASAAATSIVATVRGASSDEGHYNQYSDPGRHAETIV